MSSGLNPLYGYLDQLGIAYTTVEHPPMFTADDAREWLGKIPGLHCKNLFMKDKKGGIWLAVLPLDKRAHLGAIEKQSGSARLSFGRSESLLEVLGVAPGSVTPFALINDTARRVSAPMSEFKTSKAGDKHISAWVSKANPLHVQRAIGACVPAHGFLAI